MKIQKITSVSDDSTAHANGHQIEAWPISRYVRDGRKAGSISQPIDRSYGFEKRAA
jgi:hypothetical protein